MQPALPGANPHTGQLTVTGTAAALVSSSSGQARAPGGIVISALSTNTVPVYLGGAGVTSGTGFALHPGQMVSMPFDDPARIFAVCASTSPVITFCY